VLPRTVTVLMVFISNPDNGGTEQQGFSHLIHP